MFAAIASATPLASPQDQKDPKQAAGAEYKTTHLVPIKRSQLCVTTGAIEASGRRLKVTVPEMRAVVKHMTAPRAEVRFTYLGPTRKVKPLGSGEVRRQFGLKLRAQNGCNLVYVMWRIEPESKLVVSVKSNPGMETHAQCGTHGYTDIKPEHASGVPRLKPGSRHTLRAEMHSSKLQVFVDNAVVWDGDVGSAALAFDGPSGVRSDNAEFAFDFFAAPAAGEPKTLPCKGGEGDE